jgi:hypothetical protein
MKIWGVKNTDMHAGDEGFTILEGTDGQIANHHSVATVVIVIES